MAERRLPLECVRGGLALRAIHRRAGNVDYYFVANGDRENREVEVKFRDAKARKAQLWDPMTGEVRPWNGSRLALGPWGSAVIVFGLGAAADAPVQKWSEPEPRREHGT